LDNVLSGVPLEMVAILWLFGSGFILWRHVQDLRLLDRLVRFAVPAPATVSERCSVITSDLRIRECPMVATAAGTFSPLLWHPIVGAPRVVIPGELLEEYSDDTTDAILCHELIHLRRCDAWRRRIEVLVLTLWWWLPTTWVARRRLRELEELCTDVAVLRANPSGANAYARALLDTEEFLSRCTARDFLAVSAFTSGRLKARIARIVAHEPTSLVRTSRGVHSDNCF
jgi:beta-lactamase regulating signal transducer with metallopeptidase domain